MGKMPYQLRPALSASQPDGDTEPTPKATAAPIACALAPSSGPMWYMHKACAGFTHFTPVLFPFSLHHPSLVNDTFKTAGTLKQ